MKNKIKQLIVSVLLFIAWSQANGTSLYNQIDYRPLTADPRAYKVGDLITVLIYEQASASASAVTATGRESDFAVSAGDSHNRIGADLNLKNDFDGSGKYTRTGKLAASISAVVEKILPSGELAIAGVQSIILNNEQQKISVVGTLRPQDIGADNTVTSNRLANAKIEFTGNGLLSDKQKPGWLTRFFHWLF